jgi:glycosyltransferase involved in cell wall biosynthesis
MRILIVNKFARITGGADVYCLRIAAALRARGHAVAFLATRHPANSEGEGMFVPATVTRDNRAALAVRSQLRVASSAFWNHTAYDSMCKLISDFSPDVISAHKLYPQLSVSPLVAARRARIPIVQTVHDFEFVSASPIDDTGRRIDYDENSARFRFLNSSLFAVKRTAHRRSVARWIAISDFVAGRLRLRGIDADVLPNPAPPIVPAMRFSERRGLVFAGRLAPEKGIAHVLRLAELMPENAITVAGDGPSRAAVEDAARNLPNLRYVGLLGPDAMNNLLASALAVVVPSLWQEPGGLVALEAMARGTPVVVYSVGGMAEYVVRARAGVVVEQRPEALATACASLVDDEESWGRFSAAGIAAATGLHSLDRHCGALEQVFAEAAGQLNA